jgi:hypothetical protein
MENERARLVSKLEKYWRVMARARKDIRRRKEGETDETILTKNLPPLRFSKVQTQIDSASSSFKIAELRLVGLSFGHEALIESCDSPDWRDSICSEGSFPAKPAGRQCKERELAELRRER